MARTPRTEQHEARGDVSVVIPDDGPRFEEDAARSHNLAGQNSWVELLTLELHHPVHRGAQVVMSGQVGDSSAQGVSYQLAIIEARVVLHFGAYREVLFRGFIGGGINSHLWWTDQPIRGDRITCEARLIIDGAAGGNVNPMPDASAAASGAAFFR